MISLFFFIYLLVYYDLFIRKREIERDIEFLHVPLSLLSLQLTPQSVPFSED